MIDCILDYLGAHAPALYTCGCFRSIAGVTVRVTIRVILRIIPRVFPRGLHGFP
jgi:hypothetical protein